MTDLAIEDLECACLYAGLWRIEGFIVRRIGDRLWRIEHPDGTYTGKVVSTLRSAKVQIIDLLQEGS